MHLTYSDAQRFLLLRRQDDAPPSNVKGLASRLLNKTKSLGSSGGSRNGLSSSGAIDEESVYDDDDGRPSQEYEVGCGSRHPTDTCLVNFSSPSGLPGHQDLLLIQLP